MKLKRVIGVVGLVAVYCGPGAVLHLSGGTRREHRRRTVYHTGHGDSNSLRLEYRFLTFAGTD